MPITEELVNNRLKVLLDSFAFGDVEPKEVSKEELNSHLIKLGTHKVVNNHTLFIGWDDYLNDKEERVVWIDPEGLTYGWTFLQYETDETIDYEGLVDSFAQAFNQEMDGLTDNQRLYFFEDSKIEQAFVIVLNVTPSEEVADEVECHIFGFAKSIADGLTAEIV